MNKKMHEAESWKRKNKGDYTMNRYKCPACEIEKHLICFEFSSLIDVQEVSVHLCRGIQYSRLSKAHDALDRDYVRLPSVYLEFADRCKIAI